MCEISLSLVQGESSTALQTKGGVWFWRYPHVPNHIPCVGQMQNWIALIQSGKVIEGGFTNISNIEGLT